MLRRELIVSSLWIVSLALVVVGLGAAMQDVIDAEGRKALLGMLENPALVSMMGPAYVLANDTFGALYTTLMMLFTALTVGIMNIFLVVRLTRADEEKGRYEVVRSLPAGRLANLNSTMITAVIVNVILSLIVGLGMFAVGDEYMGFNGSMLWGASLGATGLVFAAIAALFSQLSSNSRGAKGYSFAALGFFYLLRAPGDMNADMEILSLISPLGLVLRTQSYAGDYWWPIWVIVGSAAVIFAIAYRLNISRDIDQGIIPARPGRAEGSALTRSPSGLAFKLLKTSLIVWILFMFMLGAAYGTVLGEVDEFIATNDVWQQLMLGPSGVQFALEANLSQEQIVDLLRAAVAEAGYTLPGLFMSAVTNIMGIFAIVPLLLFILKARAEEKDTRAELVLATPVSRYKYLAGYAVIAFASAIMIQLVMALGLYAVGVSVLPNPEDLPLSYMLESNLVYIPAQWVMVGAAILLIGLLPKATGAIWGYFTFTFLVMFLGRMELFPEWMQNLTPFGLVPQLPVEEINFLTLTVLTVIAAGLTAAGFVFYRRRDTNTF